MSGEVPILTIPKDILFNKRFSAISGVLVVVFQLIYFRSKSTVLWIGNAVSFLVDNVVQYAHKKWRSEIQINDVGLGTKLLNLFSIIDK